MQINSKGGSFNILFVVACFFAEVLGAALLMLVLLAVLDKKNGPPPPGLIPLVIFILVIGLAACLGVNTSFGVKPVTTSRSYISPMLNIPTTVAGEIKAPAL